MRNNKKMATNTKEESKISEKNQPKSKKLKSRIFSTPNSGRNLPKPTLKSRRMKQLVTKTKKLQKIPQKSLLMLKMTAKFMKKIAQNRSKSRV